MIPDDIKQLLHEIRLLGGSREKYQAADDWQLIKAILKDERTRAEKRADELYRDYYW